MYLIKNGTVYTMGKDGVVHTDLLLNDDGKIEALGNDLGEVNATVIDATDKAVIPGFVDAHSHIGGVREDGEDLNECTNPATPEMDAYYGIDPKDKQFKIAIQNGITTSCLTPGSGNVIGGWAIVLKSNEGRIQERLLKHPAALKAAMGINPKGVYSKKGALPMTRMGIAFILRDYLRKVKEYMAKKEAANGDPSKLPPFDLGLEHGIPVLKKEIPLKVHTYMHDMVTVVEIAKEFDILVTIDHAQGASDYYDVLSDAHVHGVIFGPICSGLFAGEGGKIDFECLKGLDDRNVNVCVMTDGPVTPNNLLVYQAGEAVRRGMDPVKALGLITSNPAKIILCEDRVGSIEKGKDADIQIYSALPTKYVDANLETVLINGKVEYKHD